MKTSSKITIWLCFLFFSVSSYGQTSKWYLQLGGGYLLKNQLEQLGFKTEKPSFLAYVEAGKTFQPLSIGIQQTFFQQYRFYRYKIKQQIQTIYAKYSLNQLSELLPYGLDPYVMAGASYTRNQFLTYEENDAGVLNLATREVSRKPTYTVGGGIQVGSRQLILGLHYQYTGGQESFTLADFETLPFATGHHLISLNIGIRLMAPELKKHNRCPRFGGKGILRF